MNEEEISKLRVRMQLAEDNNKILVNKLKEKEKNLKTLNELYKKEKKKNETIYMAITTRNVDESNYQKAIDWIIKIIEEEK